MDIREYKLLKSPEFTAGPLSKLFWCWVLPLLRKGSKTDLEVEDVYELRPEDSSASLGDLLEEKWKKEVAHADYDGRPPKLWKAIARIIYRKYILISLGYAFDELVLKTIQPIALKNFIRTFSDENSEISSNRFWDQCIYASVLILSTFLSSIVFQKMIFQIVCMGIKMRVGLSSLIYRKILRLRKCGSENANVSKLCNLVSTDVSYLNTHFVNLTYFFTAPLQLLICTYLLWTELGALIALISIAIIFALTPVQVQVGRWAMYFRTRIAKRTDNRGRFVNEVVTGIRLIKMYAWEKPFAKKIAELRKLEIDFVRKSMYIKGTRICVKVIVHKLVPFCGLMIYAVALGNRLTADKAFFSVMLFQMMIGSVATKVPNAYSDLGELLSSMKRVEQFLLESDDSGAKHETIYDYITENGMMVNGYRKKCTSPENRNGYSEPRIIMKNFMASWTKEKTTLSNLNIHASGNMLVMIVGHVGCGKSSLLNAILGEMPITNCDSNGVSMDTSYFKVHGNISYASQEAWIFPASIRQNILFGLQMNEKRYWDTVRLCCLEEDLRQFPDGDLTLVGERGVALSGGQKARVNLARALYQKADIYLLDDPLSAVDTKVGQSLFQDCIRKHLQGTLRVLVTHELKHLPMADHIIVLNRDGSIWGQGTYDQLHASAIDFSSLLSHTYVKSDDEDMNKVQKKMYLETKSEENYPQERKQNKGKDEQKMVGCVGLSTYFRYFEAGGSYLLMVLVFTGFLASQLLLNFSDFWLSQWTNAVANHSSHSNITTEEIIEQQSFYAYVYCGLIAAFIMATVSRSILFYSYCMRISVNLHNGMFQSVIRAPVKFFDDNPSGRIMNRFIKDLNQIDEKLPMTFYDFINILLNLFGMLAINISANYYTAIPSAVFLTGLWKLRGFFLKSSRDLKRIEAVAKSPMLTHVTMTFQGLTTVRALRAEERVLGQFEKIQDTHTSVFYMLVVTSRWFATCLEMMTVVYLTVVTFGFLLVTTSVQGGNVGVAISAIIVLASGLQWGIRQSAETENYMTSVERVFEYSQLESEAPLETPEDSKMKESWPCAGQISFQNVSLAYDDANTNKVLRDITFSTGSKEKIGIVGRTGAGKSSLLTALFRLTEPCHGEISIDEVATSKLGLHRLRSRISIIPQDPVLFRGTIRYNLDPFGQFQDYRLWSVLTQVDLHRQINSLDYPVSDGGNNFSVGQRQLVCLARAILRKNRILVLDEATANVDPATDQLVQQTIRKSFADCTILTIAHRLQTVMDCDRILVLDEGRIVEFDSPKTLLVNEQSVFHRMVHYAKSPT